MMKERLREYFALTQKGSENCLIAARYTFLKFFVHVFPPIVVFQFLEDLLANHVRSLHFYLLVLAMISIIAYLILNKEYTMTYDVTYEESTALRIGIAHKLKELPLSYFSKHNLSDLSQTVMMDVNNMEMVLSHAVSSSIGFLAFFSLMTIGMLFGNWILGLCVTLPIWLTIIFVFSTRKMQVNLVSKYYQKLLANADRFQEAFEMQQEIKSYSMQESVRQEVTASLDETEKVHLLAEFKMAIINIMIGILPYLAPVFTAVIGAMLFRSGKVGLLYVIGYLMAATKISSQYASFNEFFLMIFFFGDSFKRLRDLNSEPIQRGIETELEKYDIELKNVNFGYGDHAVIKDVSFIAKQGEVTALVGPSGCGKTTLLRLVSRLYDYQDGLILIDGKDIREISTKSLFDKVSVVFQNVELFDTTIMENIRIGRKNATDEEVMQAARMANIEEMIQHFPDGYQTVIGENGSKLSGGERQRISIARAFLKDAPIILLDEISASLDVENEMKIQNSINQLIQNKTVIIISHRLKSIENVNQIVVMNDGCIESIGTHTELLHKSKIYKSMVEKSRLTEDYLY